MQKAVFAAHCPYEIGDKVYTQPYGNIRTIYDIRTIHYLREGKVEFEFKFEESKADWFKADFITKRKVI